MSTYSPPSSPTSTSTSLPIIATTEAASSSGSSSTVKKEGIVKRFIRKRVKGLKGDRLTCRICLQEDHRLQMISPCECKGTSKFVHKSCLSKWRSIDGASRFRCEICHSHYRFCQSWAKASLIRLGCWAAILVYAYFLLSITQWAVCWIGLVPQISRLTAFGWQETFPPQVSEFLSLWFEFIPIGPWALLVSPCVSLKKNRRGFGTFSNWIGIWAIIFYLSFLHQNVAVAADFLYIALTSYGTLRTIRYSFFTAQVIAPSVSVILVDLNLVEKGMLSHRL